MTSPDPAVTEEPLDEWRPPRLSKRQRWWRLGHDHTVKRLSYGYCPSSLNLPRLRFGADGEHGDEYESRYVAVSWGNGNTDPLWWVELNLTHTRTGRALAAVVWWFRERGLSS